MTDITDRLIAALADRYEVQRSLGSGGMATVYVAHDLKHDREVAIKVMREDVAAELGPERFLREINIVAHLNHPHILALHDSGEADGFLYYVMPYVEDESLRKRLDCKKQLAVDEAVRIVSEVADGLGYAHDHNVVHRDVKPGNILLEAGHAVIADFGIALGEGDQGVVRESFGRTQRPVQLGVCVVRDAGRTASVCGIESQSRVGTTHCGPGAAIGDCAARCGR